MGCASFEHFANETKIIYENFESNQTQQWSILDCFKIPQTLAMLFDIESMVFMFTCYNSTQIHMQATHTRHERSRNSVQCKYYYSFSIHEPCEPCEQ